MGPRPDIEMGMVGDPDEDRARFHAVYRQNGRAVLGYALRRVVDPEDAAEVVAETFLVAWRRLAEVPPAGDARPWLLAVARRVLANHRRGRRRRDRLGERLRGELAGMAPPCSEGELVQSHAVRLALARLADDDRELLTLTSWDGLTPSELAVVLAVPAATVRTRLHRARRRLGAELEEMGVVDRPPAVLTTAEEGT